MSPFIYRSTKRRSLKEFSNVSVVYDMAGIPSIWRTFLVAELEDPQHDISV